LLAGSGFRESDPRLHTLVKEAVADIKGYSEEQTSSFVAGFTEGIARNVDSLAPREILVSKLAVDAAATKTSTMICERLTEFINKVSLRLPGGPTSETYNILLDHLRPALAEIERVVDLFRLEVGCAADLIVKAVDGKCAQFWRHWEQTCRNRAAGLEKRAAA
jgi:hypothetical protein